MKKCVLVLILAALVGTGAFALDVSVGGGMAMDFSFNNGVKYTEYGIEVNEGIRNLFFGGNFFVDLAYAEIDVSAGYGKFKYYVKAGGISDSVDYANTVQLTIGAVFKWPFVISRVVIFPFAGINYNMVLLAKDSDYGLKYQDPMKWFNQFGIMFGAGLDAYLNDNAYFRLEAGLNIRFPTKLQKDNADYWSIVDYPTSYKATVGVGPRFKLAFGRHF